MHFGLNKKAVSYFRIRPLLIIRGKLLRAFLPAREVLLQCRDKVDQPAFTQKVDALATG